MTSKALESEDPMSRSGATWCEKHQKWECSAKVGREHHGVAIRGQAYCRHHVGLTTELAKAQGDAKLAAWRAQGIERGPIDLGATVMDQLRLAQIRADVLGELLRLQYDDEGYAGLIGITRAAGRDGGSVETGESVRALVRLEGEWRDRVVKFAKTAHDMGIDERNIEIEQAKATRVVSSHIASMESGWEAIVDLIPVQEQAAALGLYREAQTTSFLEGIGRGVTVAGEVIEHG